MVHGDSLGGLVANYVGRHEKVNVVFANRTFASLNSVGFWAAGNATLSQLFREDNSNLEIETVKGNNQRKVMCMNRETFS